MTKLASFCRDTECQIFLSHFTNADYQVSQVKDLSLDSFTFELYHKMPGSAKKAMIHKTAGIMATPLLVPIEIKITSVIFDPVPAQTAQVVTMKVRLDSTRGDVFSKGRYVMLSFAEGGYRPMYPFTSPVEALINGKQTPITTINYSETLLEVSSIFIEVPE